MLEDELGQPPRMGPCPGLAAGKEPPMAQQKRLQMLALRAQIRHRGLPRPHQFADRLMARIRHPDGGQLAGPVEPGQGQGIPAVGLHALAGALRDQGGCDDGTLMPERRDLALQAIAGRTRLVAEQHFAVSAGQLADEAPHRLWGVVDLAQEADLALTALLGQGDRDLQLGGIQTDKHSAYPRHGSSLVREARRRPIRNNPRSSHRGDEPPPPAPNIRSAIHFDRDMYCWRHLTQNPFAKLKEVRAVARRYDKTDTSYTATIHLAAAIIASR